MTMKNAKTVYAQSSDIKSRTFLQYRFDMKRKAIMELEILPWLQRKLRKITNSREIHVAKSGGDRFLWFLRGGGITREPDYQVIYSDGSSELIEFQYATDEGLKFFDFKVSKIAKKSRNTAKYLPHNDRIILYVIESSRKWALIKPKWILKNGERNFVPAWRSYAFRVPKNKILPLFSYDKSLEKVIQICNSKTQLLRFSYDIIDIERIRLASVLESVIDDNKIYEILPGNLKSFYEICFALERFDKTPVNSLLWLGYLCTYADSIQRFSLKEAYWLTFIADFLYSRIPPAELPDNVLASFISMVVQLKDTIQSYKKTEGNYKSDKTSSPLLKTRYALFSINLIEDIVQDVIYCYSVKSLRPIKKIFKTLGNNNEILSIVEFVRN